MTQLMGSVRTRAMVLWAGWWLCPAMGEVRFELRSGLVQGAGHSPARGAVGWSCTLKGGL